MEIKTWGKNMNCSPSENLILTCLSFVVSSDTRNWNPDEAGQFTFAASVHEFYIPGTLTKAQHSPAWSSSHIKWQESSYDVSIEIYFDYWHQNTILQYSTYKYPCWTRHIHKRLNSVSITWEIYKNGFRAAEWTASIKDWSIISSWTYLDILTFIYQKHTTAHIFLLALTLVHILYWWDFKIWVLQDGMLCHLLTSEITWLHQHTARISKLANTEYVEWPNSFWTDHEMTAPLLRQTYITRCRVFSCLKQGCSMCDCWVISCAALICCFICTFDIQRNVINVRKLLLHIKILPISDIFCTKCWLKPIGKQSISQNSF